MSVFSSNVGGFDRVLRVLGGIVLLAIGVWLHRSSPGWGSLVLIILGAIGIGTGAFRFCLLYAALGICTGRRGETNAGATPVRK
jgi:hypothetical protein